MSKVFDLFIIGGGINGAGIARDASGRGLSVCLADKGEIGGAGELGDLVYLKDYQTHITNFFQQTNNLTNGDIKTKLDQLNAYTLKEQEKINDLL